MIILSLFE